LANAVVCVVGNVTVVNAVQLRNVLEKILNDADTVAGNVTVLIEEQPENVEEKLVHADIDVGNVTLIKDVQFKNV
jgi:hypothetical protein